MDTKKGQVGVKTENIFPIIREWLYADKAIFIRELVSNAADALAKLARLSRMGQAQGVEEADLTIDVTLDTKGKTLTISDNGVGMSVDDIERYINQIAYSGMVDFAERYQDDASDGGAFIGHFGVGFYSAFMVSDRVTIDSVSYTGAEAARWTSEDGIDYEIGPSDKTTRGTDVTLALNEEASAALTPEALRRDLMTYCGFLAWPIRLHIVGDDDRKREGVDESEPINDTAPLWKRRPSEVSDDDYKAFYHRLFEDDRDPLFWIHLNMDYPFRLQGLLYFPMMKTAYEAMNGRIKIYYNQVFVADNVDAILPDFLFLLRGALDAPDLPLNVSRSFLQRDTYVKKLATYIVKKVADKLTALATDDKAVYESYWPDLELFVKYGALRDLTFYERVKPAMLFAATDGTYVALPDLPTDVVSYTPSQDALGVYVDLATQKGSRVFVLGHELDDRLMAALEYESNGARRFVRVDAELGSGDKDSETKRALLEARFRKAAGDDTLTLRLVPLGAEQMPVLLERSEWSRRLETLKKRHGDEALKGVPNDTLNGQRAVVINEDHPLMTALVREAVQYDEGEPESGIDVTRYLYDLARLGQDELKGEALVAFLKSAADLIETLQRERFDSAEDV